MRYTMKLDEVPFEQIANGTKTIEMCLNDEKRRKIVIGDEIEFTSLLSAKTLLAKVINKYVFSSFEGVYVTTVDNSEIEHKQFSSSRLFLTKRERSEFRKRADYIEEMQTCSYSK